MKLNYLIFLAATVTVAVIIAAFASQGKRAKRLEENSELFRRGLKTLAAEQDSRFDDLERSFQKKPEDKFKANVRRFCCEGEAEV